MGKIVEVLLALTMAGTVAAAQDLPDSPSSHRFWDKPNQILFISHVALEAVDLGITHHNLGQGGREMNPMGKTLCESGTLGQLVYFGGRTAAVAGISYLLHKAGHHRMERVFLVVASVDSASGVKYSLTH